MAAAQRIQCNADLQEIRRETLLANLRQCVREVQASPDGHVYVLTDEADGAILKIEPADREVEIE